MTKRTYPDAYKTGYRRGERGAASANGFFEDLFSSEPVKQVREEGYLDGVKARLRAETKRKVRDGK